MLFSTGYTSSLCMWFNSRRGSILLLLFLQSSESLSLPDIESVHAALLKVFRDLKRAERYETVNPAVLKQAFAKHQSSFWGCIQQVFCSLVDELQIPCRE